MESFSSFISFNKVSIVHFLKIKLDKLHISSQITVECQHSLFCRLHLMKENYWIFLSWQTSKYCSHSLLISSSSILNSPFFFSLPPFFSPSSCLFLLFSFPPSSFSTKMTFVMFYTLSTILFIFNQNCMKWHDYQYKLMILGWKRRRSIKFCQYQYIPSRKYQRVTLSKLENHMYRLRLFSLI